MSDWPWLDRIYERCPLVLLPVLVPLVTVVLFALCLMAPGAVALAIYGAIRLVGLL